MITDQSANLLLGSLIAEAYMEERITPLQQSEIIGYLNDLQLRSMAKGRKGTPKNDGNDTSDKAGNREGRMETDPKGAVLDKQY